MNVIHSRISYTDEEKMRVVFSYLIFRVSRINLKYGSLAKFTNDFKLAGQTNGKIYIIAEMRRPHGYLADLIYEKLVHLGFQQKEDYVFGYEYPTNGDEDNCQSLLYRQIPDLVGIEWLGSKITSRGNLVWYQP